MREGSDSCIRGFLCHLENNTLIPGCGSSIPSLCAPIARVHPSPATSSGSLSGHSFTQIKINSESLFFLFFFHAVLLSILSDPEHPPPPTERLLQRLRHNVTPPGFMAKLARERTMERETGKMMGG